MSNPTTSAYYLPTTAFAFPSWKDHARAKASVRQSCFRRWSILYNEEGDIPDPSIWLATNQNSSYNVTELLLGNEQYFNSIVQHFSVELWLSKALPKALDTVVSIGLCDWWQENLPQKGNCRTPTGEMAGVSTMAICPFLITSSKLPRDSSTQCNFYGNGTKLWPTHQVLFGLSKCVIIWKSWSWP